MILLKITTIIVLYLLFALLHSYTAGNKLKEKTALRHPQFMPYYRLSYNLAAFITYYFVYNWSPSIDIKLYDLPYPWDYAVLLPQLIALAAILWTMRYFNLQEFLGISQALRGLYGQYNTASMDGEQTFNTTGPYSLSRHPMYFFILIFLIARPYMFLDYAVHTACIAVYFYIGGAREEQRMTALFGTPYVDYMNRVPRMLPGFNFKKKSQPENKL